MARDVAILNAIRQQLIDTNEFDGVYRSTLPETFGQAAGDRKAAVVQPDRWEEVSESADPTVIQSTRRVSWRLTLIVREEDPETREDELDRLLGVCQNTLDGVVFADATLPYWTWLKSGRYEEARPPEQRMTVEGAFSYYVQGFTGHDTLEGA